MGTESFSMLDALQGARGLLPDAPRLPQVGPSRVREHQYQDRDQSEADHRAPNSLSAEGIEADTIGTARAKSDALRYLLPGVRTLNATLSGFEQVGHHKLLSAADTGRH
jgi:hypothetical protein